MSEWRPVQGWDGYYEVSKDGQLRSCARQVIRKDGIVMNWKPRLLSLHKDGGGYLGAVVTRQGAPVRLKVHRCVALAFLPNPDNHPVVNHLNCNRTDNRADNLEWCTHKHNTQHAISMGRPIGKRKINGV